MEKHTNKKLIAGVLALSCAFILASCDKVESLPNNYKDPIIAETSGNEKIYDNEMSVIYDAITSGKSEKVVDEILKIISTDKYGLYYSEEGKDGLVEVVSDFVKTGSKQKILAFIEAHPAYRHADDEKIVSGKYTKDDIAIMRAVKFVETVNNKVIKHFYDEVKSGSFNDEYGVFQEKKLAYNYYSKLYKIDVQDITLESNYYKGFVTNSLHEYPQSGDTVTIYDYVHINEADKNYYRDYIKREIVPQVYKDRIVEEYILANNYSVLGRSYGRKTNIAKLSYDATNKTFADDLVRKYATTYVLNNEEGIPFATSQTILENAWRGFKDLKLNENEEPVLIALDSTEEALLASVGKQPGDPVVTGIDGLGTLQAYKDTKLGNLLEEYAKAQKAEATRFATDEQASALNKFTESGKHPKEKGFVSELLKLAQESSFKNGWSVKNGGLSDYPTDLRDRLYNINVSNSLDDSTFVYDEAKSYVRPIKGSYYLVPSKTEKIDVNPLNFIFADSSSTSYYIVQVEEAPSTSKLNLDNASGYIKSKEAEPLKCEDFAREISRVISTRDSYTNSAYTEVFKECEFIYHDDVIYEYFKTTYPDLFD